MSSESTRREEYAKDFPSADMTMRVIAFTPTGSRGWISFQIRDALDAGLS